MGRRSAALVLLLAALGAAGCNAWRALFPSHAHETARPELPARLEAPALLLFTKTNGYRHHEAIEAGTALFESIARARGMSLYHTESGGVFNPQDLARFAAAIWHNTSGDVLNDDQRAAFRAWLEAGGGFVGVHGAGGDFDYDWRWYVEELIGAQFIGHIMGPQFQEATVVVEDREHPATRDLPERWTHLEEWYSFDASVRERPEFRVLATVDESTYSPLLEVLWTERDLAMGDHPVVWSRCIERGRAFFSALGHRADAYDEPRHRRLLEGAVAWAARAEGTGCD